MKKPYVIILVISMAVSGLCLAFICSLGDLSPDPPRATQMTMQDVSFLAATFVLISAVLFCGISGIYWVVTRMGK